MNNSIRRVLIHACCGPCCLMPVLKLREEGLETALFFYNPNIHPQEEYDLRRQALAEAAHKLDIPVYWEDEVEGVALNPAGSPFDVNPQKWVARLEGNIQEGPRCVPCYRDRLVPAAQVAARLGFEAFTTSLLYSRYQQHELIIAEAECAAQEAGNTFLYRDFRPWWQDGIDMSKKLGLYRQKWCGCILSQGEAERQRAEMKARKALIKAQKQAAREGNPAPLV